MYSVRDGRRVLALVYGGMSPEHDVSVRSAQSVLSVIDRTRFAVLLVYISREGLWAVSDAPSDADVDERTMRMAHGKKADVSFLAAVDVVFPMLHGPMGEDGTIQGMLDVLGVPYVGCGVLASAIGMDKISMKHVCAARGIPQCRWMAVVARDFARDAARVRARIAQSIGYPCFVKPSRGGSSLGISRVAAPDALDEALEEALRHDARLIIEEALHVREIEVGMLGGEDVRTSVVGEVRCPSVFYDTAAKYSSAHTELIVPAPIDDDIADAARALAVDAYEAIDARGLARVDFFYRESDRALLLNEINTMPGFTSMSMYPKLWMHSGVAIDVLVQTLIDQAMRHSCSSVQIGVP
ncbi:MAG: D-alanine--D-alanine ligase [Paenibacillaceae bacterium]|nr:D-alanine--D-alanine ligase [Paenibacillaceae bacterium]